MMLLPTGILGAATPPAACASWRPQYSGRTVVSAGDCFPVPGAPGGRMGRWGAPPPLSRGGRIVRLGVEIDRQPVQKQRQERVVADEHGQLDQAALAERHAELVNDGSVGLAIARQRLGVSDGGLL